MAKLLDPVMLSIAATSTVIEGIAAAFEQQAKTTFTGEQVAKVLRTSAEKIPAEIEMRFRPPAPSEEE